MLKHPKGIAWIRENKSWLTAIEYCMENQTIYVVRRASAFVTDFLFKVTSDEELCSELIGIVLKPLDDNVFEEEFGRIFVDSSDLQQKVMPTINLTCSILDRYIREDKTSCVANHIINTHKANRNLWKLTDMTHDRLFFDKIMNCHVYINYARLADTLKEDKTLEKAPGPINDFNDFGLNFLNSVKYCILKNHHMTVLSVTKLYYMLWKTLGDRVPEEILLGNQMTKFENQIILFQIMPILIVMRKSSSIYTEVTNEYIMKLFNISAEHTMRICYSFRDSLLRDDTKITDIACKAIQSVLSIQKMLRRDCAVIVFQAMCHTVKGYAVMQREGDLLQVGEQPNLLTAVLTGLHTIVKNFRITWKESYETIGVLNFMLYLLEHSNLTSTVCGKIDNLLT